MPRYTMDLWRVVEFDAANDEEAAGQAREALDASKAASGFARVVEYEADVRRVKGRARVLFEEHAGREAAA